MISFITNFLIRFGFTINDLLGFYNLNMGRVGIIAYIKDGYRDNG